MANLRRAEKRIRKLASNLNRELTVDAAITAGLGLIFGLVIYAVLFCIICFALYNPLWGMGLSRLQFAGVATLLMLAVATVAAWGHFNPLAGLKPMTDQQMMLTLASQAGGGLHYFSPQHAAAGAVAILLGGPANLCEAISIWCRRVPDDDDLFRDAVELLSECEAPLPVKKIRNPQAAVLLRRLILVTLGGSEADPVLTTTSKGAAILESRQTN